MEDKGWYAQARSVLSSTRDLTLHIAGSAAAAIRRDLTTIGLGEGTQRAGWSTFWHMVRYRHFYRLMPIATALGLGISLEDSHDGKLVVRINDRIGRDTAAHGVLVVQKARGGR